MPNFGAADAARLTQQRCLEFALGNQKDDHETPGHPAAVFTGICHAAHAMMCEMFETTSNRTELSMQPVPSGGCHVYLIKKIGVKKIYVNNPSYSIEIRIIFICIAVN